MLEEIITKGESYQNQTIFYNRCSLEEDLHFTYLNKVESAFSPFIKDVKLRSALGKLDASSAGTLQKYLLIAFDKEAGC